VVSWFKFKDCDGFGVGDSEAVGEELMVVVRELWD